MTGAVAVGGGPYPPGWWWGHPCSHRRCSVGCLDSAKEACEGEVVAEELEDNKEEGDDGFLLLPFF